MEQQIILTHEDYIEQLDNDYRKLNERETEELLQINPNIKIDEIIVLDSGYMNVESYDDEICEYLDCLELLETKVYDNINDIELKQLSLDINSGEKEKDSICFNKNITCYQEKQLVATYNCLGWAMGISKWLSTSVIDDYIKNGSTKTEAIKKFITFYHEEFPDTHPANFEKILGALHVLDSKPELIKNNTVIFYFKDNYATHAARYIEDFGDGEPINQWTSKMGPQLLITHQESEDLAPNFYGDQFIYLEIN